jgi:CheY-like chemotaxis protein
VPPTRVLLVEDDAVQRERMRGWLEGPQWTVREAENGREALKRIEENKPDVILLDLMMPQMDGFAVVAALQKEAGWRDIPVIVITLLDLDARLLHCHFSHDHPSSATRLSARCSEFDLIVMGVTAFFLSSL